MSKTMEVNLECGGSIQKVLGNFLCVREWKDIQEKISLRCNSQPGRLSRSLAVLWVSPF